VFPNIVLIQQLVLQVSEGISMFCYGTSQSAAAGICCMAVLVLPVQVDRALHELTQAMSSSISIQDRKKGEEWVARGAVLFTAVNDIWCSKQSQECVYLCSLNK
jgi:hypothetical protein